MISSCSRWLSPPMTTSRAWAMTAGVLQGVVGHDPGRDPVQPLAALVRPDLGPQQPQAHLDEPVVQVDQHHVVPALGDGMVEGDRADLLGVRDAPAPRRTPPNCPFRAGSRKTGLPPESLGSGSAAGCPASVRPTSTTLLDVVRREPQFPLRLPVLLQQVAWICFARSRSNLSILRTGSDLRLGLRRCAERRSRRPSIASSTSSARTVPTLPRSSRIVSTFWATRIRNSRSASRSPAAVGERRPLPLLVALADEVVDADLVRPSGRGGRCARSAAPCGSGSTGSRSG